MNSVRNFRFSYSAVDAKWLLLFLLGFEFLLVSGYLLTHIVAPNLSWGAIKRLLNVDSEVSIPTWFSSIQLLAIGLLLMVQAPSAKQLRIVLFILGLGFLFLSMDEAAMVHDTVWLSAHALNSPRLKGIEYLAWMVPYVCIGLVGLAAGYRSVLFAWRNFRWESVVVASGGAVFVTGGMAIEAFTLYLFSIARDERFLLAVAAEEMFEMVGVSIMLYGFMLLGIRIQSQAFGQAAAASTNSLSRSSRAATNARTTDF